MRTAKLTPEQKQQQKQEKIALICVGTICILISIVLCCILIYKCPTLLYTDLTIIQLMIKTDPRVDCYNKDKFYSIPIVLLLVVGIIMLVLGITIPDPEI